MPFRNLGGLDPAAPTILGIDPGTRVLGYGALCLQRGAPRLLECGVLSAPASQGVAARLGRIQAELEALVVRLRPTVLAVEGAFSSRNVRSALRLGEARGVVLALAGRRGLAVTEIAPAAAKKAVLGHGGGSKEQVARMVAVLLGRRDLGVPLDATDALAVALAHVNELRLERLVRRPAR